MRRVLVPSCAGPLLAAVVLLAGCGAGGSAPSAAATTTSSSAASSSAAPLAQTPFCQQSSAALAELAPAFSSNKSDPSKLAPILQKAADQVGGIQPPAAIAADWKTLANSLSDFASSYGDVNPQDPASASAFAQRSATLLASLGTAAGHVETYLATNCGLTAPTTLPAAPST